MEQILLFFVCIGSLLTYAMTSSTVVIGSAMRDSVASQEMAKELLDPWTVNIRCSSSQMCIFLNIEWLQNRWEVTDLRRLSLVNNCDELVQRNASHVMLCTEPGKFLSCGTEFSVNATHVAYSNNVTVAEDESDDALMTSHQRKWFPWKCIYPLHVMVGVRFNPIISPITHVLGSKFGEGEFDVVMFLYEDSSYTSVYETSPELKENDRLYVQVQLSEGPPQANLLVVTCWATPVNDPRHNEYFPVIENYCPYPSQADVVMKRNGISHAARWESRVFSFIDYKKIFMHCNVRVCFGDDSCNQTCPASSTTSFRRRRDVTDDVTVSLGPIELSSGVLTVKSRRRVYNDVITEASVMDKTERDDDDTVKDSTLLGMPRIATYVIILLLVLLAFIFMTSAAACIVRRKQAKKCVKITSKRQPVMSSINTPVRTRSLAMASRFDIPVAN